MKKNYKLPRMRAVEIKASSLLSDSDVMRIHMDDYSTYNKSTRTNPNAVNWDGEGTGSDF